MPKTKKRKRRQSGGFIGDEERKRQAKVLQARLDARKRNNSGQTGVNHDNELFTQAKVVLLDYFKENADRIMITNSDEENMFKTKVENLRNGANNKQTKQIDEIYNMYTTNKTEYQRLTEQQRKTRMEDIKRQLAELEHDALFARDLKTFYDLIGNDDKVPEAAAVIEKKISNEFIIALLRGIKNAAMSDFKIGTLEEDKTEKGEHVTKLKKIYMNGNQPNVENIKKSFINENGMFIVSDDLNDEDKTLLRQLKLHTTNSSLTPEKWNEEVYGTGAVDREMMQKMRDNRDKRLEKERLEKEGLVGEGAVNREDIFTDENAPEANPGQEAARPEGFEKETPHTVNGGKKSRKKRRKRSRSKGAKCGGTKRKGKRSSKRSTKRRRSRRTKKH